MDRRDFLKTLGLLAVTAPAGIAALKQVEFEPEIDPVVFADVAEKASEAAGKMGEMAQCAQDCAEAMAPLVPKTHNGLPLYTALEIELRQDPTPVRYDGDYGPIAGRSSPPYCLATIAPVAMEAIHVGERVAVQYKNNPMVMYDGLLTHYICSTFEFPAQIRLDGISAII